MARLKDHEKALALRRQEYSYSQIKKILKINKSTLSNWLKDYPLSKQRVRELRDWNEQRIERYRDTMKQKREKRLNEIYNFEKGAIFPLTNKELRMIGLGLYWGEGTKYRMDCLSISNTDPSIIKFFIFWLNKTLGVTINKLTVYLHLYNNMNIKKEMSYWSTILEIPLSQFNKPYIKITSSERINHKGGFGHGTCNVKIGDARLSEKILMAIKVISDKYNHGRV